MNLYNYIFNKNSSEIKQLDIKTKPVLINVHVPKKKDVIYIVYNRASDTILGAYDNLILAKSHGQKATYNNCYILQVKLNAGCNYINKIIFEDK